MLRDEDNEFKQGKYIGNMSFFKNKKLERREGGILVFWLRVEMKDKKEELEQER